MSRPAVYTAFTPAISRETTAADKAQVQKAHLIRHASALSIRHLFAVIGTWSPYYARAILTNSLVWAAIEVHMVIFFFLTVAASDINFQGIAIPEDDYHVQGISKDKPLKYSPILGLQTLTLKYILRGSDMDESGKLAKVTTTSIYHVKLGLRVYGGILGAVATMLMKKWPHQRKIAVAAIVYVTSIATIFASNNYSIVKLVLVIAVACKEVCFFAVLMNLTQNLPSHIRPIAFFWLSTARSVFATTTLMSFRLSSHWPPIGLVVPIMIFLAAVAHFFLAPDSLLLIVLEQEGDVLKRLIKKYKEDRPAIDGNTLIDDVIYIRPATVSSWKRCLKLLTVKTFVLKYIILLGILSILQIRDDLTIVGQFKMMNFGILEAFFIRYVAVFLGGSLAVVMLHFYGRRPTLVYSYLINIASYAVFLTIPLTTYNTCALFAGDSSGTETWTNLAIASNFLQTISYYTAETTVTLMLMEHIPVEDHQYLVPMTFMIANIAIFITRLILRNNFVLDAIQYPNIHYFTVCFVLSLLFGLLLPFLDNTRVLPLKSDEFKCYYFKKQKYPKNPSTRDDSAFNEVAEPTAVSPSQSHTER